MIVKNNMYFITYLYHKNSLSFIMISSHLFKFYL